MFGGFEDILVFGMVVSDSGITSEYRLSLPLDSLHVRLLMVERAHLPAEAWDFLLSNSHWRLYQNSCPGAFLIHDGERTNMLAGDVYLIPAGREVRSFNTVSLTQFYIHFDLIGLPQIALRELFSGPVRVPSPEQFKATVTRFGESIRSDEDAALGTECLAKAVVYEALGHYLMAVPAEQRERWGRRLTKIGPVLAAIQRIEDAPASRLTIAELAGLCHMSEDHFIRRFGDCAGQSPISYILDRRIALAAQRLLFTDESIEAVATATGFGNRYYFTRMFTRHTGCPPAAFRKGAR